MCSKNRTLIIAGKIFVLKHCFYYLNAQNVKQNNSTKQFFVSPGNSSLVGILITTGEVTDILTMI